MGAPLAAISRRLPGAAPCRFAWVSLPSRGCGWSPPGKRAAHPAPHALLAGAGAAASPGTLGPPGARGGREAAEGPGAEGGRPGRAGPGVHLRVDVAARGRTAGRSRPRWAEALLGRTGRCAGVGVGVGKGAPGTPAPHLAAGPDAGLRGGSASVVPALTVLPSGEPHPSLLDRLAAF